MLYYDRYSFQRAGEGGFPCKHGWEVVDTSDGQVLMLVPTARAAQREAKKHNNGLRRR